MIDFLARTAWVHQLALVVGGIVLGLLAERFLVRALHSIAKKTQSTWDDLVIQTIHRMPLLWLTLAGVWAALLVRGVDAAVRERVGQVIVVLVIGSLTIVATRFASGSVDRIAVRSGTGLPSTTLVNNLVKLLIGTLGLFLILQNLGIEITPLITALGIGGLAVALALQDTLSNLFAGVTIILTGQIRPTDYIRLEEGPQGFVTDVKSPPHDDPHLPERKTWWSCPTAFWPRRSSRTTTSRERSSGSPFPWGSRMTAISLTSSVSP